jgi:hypothetical protein
MNKKDPERIWLEPIGDPTKWVDERTWCQDKVWPNSEEPGEPTEYVRADLYEKVISDRPYITGWNAGFEYVHGPLRFPTMLRKMWSGAEVQDWLNTQRIEAARQIAADEGSQVNQLRNILQRLIDDIQLMQNKDGTLSEWFGAFPEHEINYTGPLNNIESVNIEWPDLADTVKLAEKLLKGET